MSHYRDSKEKYKNEFPDTAERGGCLSVFLALLLVSNAVLLIFLFMGMGNPQGLPEPYRMLPQFMLYWELLSSLAAVISTVALWNWKSWGYYGLFALYVLEAILCFFTGNYIGVASAIIELCILLYLMRDKADYLE